ncbi:MAG: Na+/H+ antiporter subunit E [Arachnia sp.]
MIVPRNKSKKALRERLHSRPLSILLMVVVWCALWGSVHPMTIVGGIVFGYLITLVFPLPPMHWEGRFHPIGFVVMIAHLLVDLCMSSWRMLQLAFQRKVKLNAGIVRVELASDSDLYQVIVAELISLVPGTVVVEVVRHPRRLYLHALDLVGPDPVAKVQQMVHDVETRALNAFGSREEIAAFRAALASSRDEELELEVEES